MTEQNERYFTLKTIADVLNVNLATLRHYYHRGAFLLFDDDIETPASPSPTLLCLRSVWTLAITFELMKLGIDCRRAFRLAAKVREANHWGGLMVCHKWRGEPEVKLITTSQIAAFDFADYLEDFAALILVPLDDIVERTCASLGMFEEA